MTHRTRAAAVAMAILLAGCSDAAPARTGMPPKTRATPAAVPTATAAETPGEAQPPTPSLQLTGEGLAAAIDVDRLREHLRALQAIADEADGDRSYESLGAERTELPIRLALVEARYFIERHAFAFPRGTAHSLITEIGDGEQVIMLGAHLDSAPGSPGLNDNGSGVAALLAVAEALRDGPRPDATVRFAFWGAEEGGPFGSAAYVESLPPDERARIRAYLNVDMIGSPNAVRFVYDEAGAAPGSDELTELLAVILEDAGLPWEPIDLQGDSDHGPFAEAGVPTGGIFTGGIEPVTEAQAARHGAVAGEPADPCSHRACDTIENVDLATLEEMTRVIAHAVAQLAGGAG